MSSLRGSIALPPRQDTFPKIFFKHQIRPNAKPKQLSSLSVVGQTAIITGGNTGLGLESSRILLSLQLSHLILAVRTPKKGEEAAISLRKLYSKAKIEVWKLDMNSYESIRAFAKKSATLKRLDIAILSAGIMNVAFTATAITGYEEQFQVNYLSTALLALLLLPVLKNNNPSGTPGRLTMVASGAALIAEFSERTEVPLLPVYKKSDGWSSSAAKKRYDTSKGLVLMLVYKLSQMTKAENTIINVVDPSFTPGTNFFRDLPVIMRLLLWPIVMLLGTSVNNAGWRYVDTAVARGEESHGSFISDWEVSPFNAFMYTKDGNNFMDRLWSETLKELDFPEVREVLASSQEKSTG